MPYYTRDERENLLHDYQYPHRGPRNAIYAANIFIFGGADVLRLGHALFYPPLANAF